MKILFNCLTMGKGGAERVIALLANEFSKENDVSILTLARSEDAYKLGVGVKRIQVDNTSYRNDGKMKKVMRKISLMRLIKLKKNIVAEKPDIVISFLPEPSLRLMFVSRLSREVRRIPKIISVRNDPKKDFGNPLIRCAMKALYRNVDGMVYQTEDAKKYFDDIIKTKKQVVISNPIDPSMLIKPKLDERREKIIISVGRLERQKNHEMLIKSFAKTLKGRDHGYLLKIYGEGSLRKYLQSLIDGLGIEDRVFLAGQIDDVPQKLNSARIFAFSSYYEGMPNALMEAMAVGLPCVSTDCPCGGPKSLIRNGENGLLIRNKDEREMHDALVMLMDDDQLRKKMADSALGVRKSNSVDVIMRKWKKIVNDVRNK